MMIHGMCSLGCHVREALTLLVDCGFNLGMRMTSHMWESNTTLDHLHPFTKHNHSPLNATLAHHSANTHRRPSTTFAWNLSESFSMGNTQK